MAAASKAIQTLAPEPTSEVAAKKPTYRIKPNRFMAQLHGYRNTQWHAYVDDGTPFEAVTNPDFWAHVTFPNNMKIGDSIEVVPDDGSYVAFLRVTNVGRVWAKVAVLAKHELVKETAIGDTGVAGYRVEFKGQLNKHSVVRESDNEILKSGFATLAEAHAWLAEHAKAMAA